MNTREERRQELRAEMERRRDGALDATAPAWRTRSRRRPLAVITVLIVLALLVMAHLLATRPLWLLVGFLVGTVFFVALRVLTRGLAERADTQLDERDRALRDRAVRWTFAVAPGALILLGVYAGITGAQPDLALRITCLAFITAWASVGAPSVVLAWTLPDDDPEDRA